MLDLLLESEQDIGTSRQINDAEAEQLAKAALKARADKVAAEAEEQRLKKLLAISGHSEFLKDLEEPEYFGCYKVIPKDSTPVRIEMRLNNGAMKAEAEERLRKVFGEAYDDFFEASTELQKILSYDKLLEAFHKAGKSPWSCLYLEVKKDKEEEVIRIGKNTVASRKYIKPQKEFFSKLQDYGIRLTGAVKRFLGEYLPAAVEPTVILGTRGTSK